MLIPGVGSGTLNPAAPVTVVRAGVESAESVRAAPTCRLTENGSKLPPIRRDRKSTRLNSSHLVISYAVFCLKKKKNNHTAHDSVQLEHTPNTQAAMRQPAPGVTTGHHRTQRRPRLGRPPIAPLPVRTCDALD